MEQHRVSGIAQAGCCFLWARRACSPHCIRMVVAAAARRGCDLLHYSMTAVALILNFLVCMTN